MAGRGNVHTLHAERFARRAGRHRADGWRRDDSTCYRCYGATCALFLCGLVALLKCFEKKARAGAWAQERPHPAAPVVSVPSTVQACAGARRRVPWLERRPTLRARPERATPGNEWSRCLRHRGARRTSARPRMRSCWPSRWWAAFRRDVRAPSAAACRRRTPRGPEHARRGPQHSWRQGPRWRPKRLEPWPRLAPQSRRAAPASRHPITPRCRWPPQRRPGPGRRPRSGQARRR